MSVSQNGLLFEELGSDLDVQSVCESLRNDDNIKKRLITTTGSGRNTRQFGNTAVSGTVGVGNLSLSALLARLKAFQLPRSAGL